MWQAPIGHGALGEQHEALGAGVQRRRVGARLNRQVWIDGPRPRPKPLEVLAPLFGLWSIRRVCDSSGVVASHGRPPPFTLRSHGKTGHRARIATPATLRSD